MTPAELIKRMSEMLGIPEATLVVADRSLVVAGLRSKQEKGRGAGKISASDAAHLLTAALGAGQPKDAVSAVQLYSETRAQNSAAAKGQSEAMGLGELAALPPEHNFIDALAALFEAAATGSLARWLETESRAMGATKWAVAPRMEIAFLSPGPVGDLRIAGIEKTTLAIRYAVPSPWVAGGDPTSAKIEKWENEVRTQQTGVDLEQYRRITGRTILHIAEGLSAKKER